MNSQNFVLVNVSNKKTTNSRISVKMIQVKPALIKAALIKAASIKAVSIKRVSIKKDKRISIKKAINRIIIEVKKIVEKKIILTTKNEKVTNFCWYLINLNKTNMIEKIRRYQALIEYLISKALFIRLIQKLMSRNKNFRWQASVMKSLQKAIETWVIFYFQNWYIFHDFFSRNVC